MFVTVWTKAVVCLKRASVWKMEFSVGVPSLSHALLSLAPILVFSTFFISGKNMSKGKYGNMRKYETLKDYFTLLQQPTVT